MKTKKLNEEDDKKACCKIVSVMTIDERGQIVLPRELRDKVNIKAGDRFAVVYWEQNNKSCVSLIKMDDFTGTVKDYLRPVMKGILDNKQ